MCVLGLLVGERMAHGKRDQRSNILLRVPRCTYEKHYLLETWLKELASISSSLFYKKENEEFVSFLLLFFKRINFILIFRS